VHTHVIYQYECVLSYVALTITLPQHTANPYSHAIFPRHTTTPQCHTARSSCEHAALSRRTPTTWTQFHVELWNSIPRLREIAPRNLTAACNCPSQSHAANHAAFPRPSPTRQRRSVVASFLTIRGKEGGRTLATCLWPSATWGSRNLPYLAGSACSWWWPPPRTGRTSRACCWTTRLARIPSPAHGGKRPHAAAAAPKYAASQTMTHTHARVLGHAPQSSQPGCGFWRSLARGTALEEGAGWWGEWQERQDACSWTPPR